MWNINIRRDLPCLRRDGLTAIVLCRLVSNVLMDTWFTTEPVLAKILEAGPDVIGMVKQLKQRYNYQGRFHTLPELRRFVLFDNGKNIFGSIVAATKTRIPVKIVIVRNRNKKSECLYLLSTDATLLEWIRRKENDEKTYEK